jgi:hypothetical protein
MIGNRPFLRGCEGALALELMSAVGCKHPLNYQHGKSRGDKPGTGGTNFEEFPRTLPRLESLGQVAKLIGELEAMPNRAVLNQTNQLRVIG